MTQLQKERRVAVTSPLGDDVLLLRRMTGSEELGRLFEYSLDLLSKDHELKLGDLLGQSVNVELDLPEGEKRYFNGIVSRFSHVGELGRYARYEATLRPWLWFLTRTTDCRIFQEMKVPDIIKKIFREHGFTDFNDSLSADYRTWVNCVQYRETDFNFVSRLMEQEGIYYYFQHEDGKHTLVLADDSSAHEAVPGYEEVLFFPPGDADAGEGDHLFDWQVSQEVQPGSYALHDFDFEKPKANLLVRSIIAREHAESEFEVYDCPGDYCEHSDGDAYVRVRLEELQGQHEVLKGTTNARGLCTGALFSQTDNPRSDQNRDYLIIAADYELMSNEYESVGASDDRGPTYTSSVTCIDSKQPYRSPRLTPKPVVQGPQTAIVVGKSGEEIWTDKYGRIKVQFHWDRYGKSDENSSCWIRVSHPWAGKGWGSVAIPRIGQEVVVDFLEGDPDRPLVTGRVYNADCMPPYGLPSGGMVSGFKSSSTPGGGGHNEISADDTKGKEKVTIHGQYNMDTTVQNDQSNTVNNNRTTSIAVDDSETVGSNQTISVGADQSQTIDGNQTIDIGADQSQTIGGSQTISVSGSRKKTVGATQTTSISVAESHTVGAGRSHSVGGGEAINIGGGQAVSVGGIQVVTVGGARTVIVGAVQSMNVGGSHKLSAATISETSKGTIKIKAGGTCMIEAPTIVLKAGGSKITLASGGITIKGSKVTVKADGSASIKAGGSIKIKGSNIGED